MLVAPEEGVTVMSFKKIMVIIAGLILWSLSFLQPQPLQAVSQSVVINELLWMGSSVSSADEWIELRNISDVSVDISGWSMTKKSNGSEVLMVTLPAGSQIAPNGYFVISNYPNTSVNSTIAIVPQLVSTDVALNNTALQIRLYDASHNLVDIADDGSGNPLAGSYDSAKKIYASMERNPIPGDGTLAASWHTASHSVGLKPGAVEVATPGNGNSNGLPVAEAGPNQSSRVGEVVNFDGSDSYDPEGQVLSAHWDFGDDAVGDALTPSHVYTTAGTYIITLTVSDGTDSTSDTTTISVAAVSAISTPAPSTPEAPISDVTKTSCRGLSISEVLPNPLGVDTGEFIELMNTGDEDVPVKDCTIWTSATRSYKLDSVTIVPRGQYLAINKADSKLTLNNGGTTVRLLDVTGEELDRVTYGNAPEGQSWSVFSGKWSWTMQPTLGKQNILTIPTLQPSTATAASKKTEVKKIEPIIQEVDLHDIQELDSGDRVRVHGNVVVGRDVLGVTMITIQSDDGGVSVSIPNGSPSLDVGQAVTLTGTVRLKQGRRYVAADSKTIQPGVIGQMLQPTSLPTDDVGVEQADQLVHVKGIVGLASGNSIEIDDGSGPLSVYIKSSTGIVRPKVKAGDTVDVVGIVSVATSGVRLLPRSSNDLHVERVLGAATTSSTPVYVAPAASARQTLWYWLLVVLGVIAVSLRPMWHWWKKKKTTMKT